jgi:hypothetical protein
MKFLLFYSKTYFMVVISACYPEGGTYIAGNWEKSEDVF